MHRDPSHHTIWRTVADPPSQATLASLHQQSVSASSGAQCHPSDGAATAGLQTQDIIRWRCCRRPSYWPTVTVQLAPSRPMAEETCPDGYLRSAGRPSSRFRTVAWMGGWASRAVKLRVCQPGTAANCLVRGRGRVAGPMRLLCPHIKHVCVPCSRPSSTTSSTLTTQRPRFHSAVPILYPHT